MYLCLFNSTRGSVLSIQYFACLLVLTTFSNMTLSCWTVFIGWYLGNSLYHSTIWSYIQRLMITEDTQQLKILSMHGMRSATELVIKIHIFNFPNFCFKHTLWRLFQKTVQGELIPVLYKPMNMNHMLSNCQI